MKKFTLSLTKLLPSVGLVVLSIGVCFYVTAQPYQHSGKTQMQILNYFAPRVYQDTRNDNPNNYSFEEQQDMITKIDFDGDWDARNNWEHNVGGDPSFNGGQPYAPPAYAYTSFIETETHFYLGYYYFHPTDDAEWQFSGLSDAVNWFFDGNEVGIPTDNDWNDRHENDVEAVVLMIEKPSDPNQYGTFVAMLTEQHGDFTPYKASDVRFTDSHVRIYITSNGMSTDDHGHGIRAYLNSETGDFGGDDGIIYNVGDIAEIPTNTEKKSNGSFYEYKYRLIPVDELWNRRFDTSHHPFKGYEDFGGQGDDGKGPGAHLFWANHYISNPHALFFTSFPPNSLGIGTSPTYLYNPFSKATTESTSGGKYIDPTSNQYTNSDNGGWTFGGDLAVYYSNIGSPSKRGVIYPNRGTVTIQGSGADIWGNSDQFNFAYRRLTGDGEIIVKLNNMQQNINPWSKAGIMIRETLDANSKNVFFGLSSKNWDTFQYRAATGGTTVKTGGNRFSSDPIWLKIVRQQNSITPYYSYDGVTWNLHSVNYSVPMNCNVYIGLAVTSHDPNWLCSATFDQITVNDLSDQLACVCTSSGKNLGSNQSEWINRFQIGSGGSSYGTLDNTSGNNWTGYGDYYSFHLAYRKALQTDPGKTYPFTITPGYKSTQYAEMYAIWIDLNADGDFDDPGEEAYKSVSPVIGPVSGTITIPSYAKLAPARIRVSMKRGAIPGPCENDFYGEVEDYGLQVINQRNYCEPTISYQPFVFYSFIRKTVIGNVETVSSNDGYKIFTDRTIIAYAGSNLKATITPREGTTTQIAVLHYVIFIDYNFDGDFSDPGEKVYESTHGPNAGMVPVKTTDIPIPQNLSLNTRMRVMVYETPSYQPGNSCGEFAGEVEDYLLSIVNDPPAVYNLSFGSVCKGENLVVNLTDTDVNTTYEVLVNDLGAGATIQGTGNAASITVDGKAFRHGDSISVRATKANGSQKLMLPNYSTVTVNGVGEIFTITNQNPLLVSLGNSLSITLDGSETGVTYQVFVNGIPSGVNQSGTGNPMSFTVPPTKFTDNDVISIIANKDGCTTLMEGFAIVNYQSCAGGGSTSQAWIESITFNGRVIQTGNNGGYANFTGNYLLESYGLTQSITITPGFSGTAVAQYNKVWIDFNQDGDFTDAGELVVAPSSTTTSAYSAGIAIPATAKNGTTKMRISRRSTNSTDPCYTAGAGEVEEYTILIDKYCKSKGTSASRYISKVQIGELVNNSGLDNGYGDYSYLRLNTNRGQSVSLSINSSVTTSGQNFKIYIDYNQDFDFTDPGENVYTGTGNGIVNGSFTIPATANTGETQMRVILKNSSISGSCENGHDGETEDYTVRISSNYCVSSGNNSTNKWIQSVNINNQVINTSGNNGGYANFTSFVATAAQGGSLPMTVWGGSNYGHRLVAWIDFNNDSDFSDQGERVYDLVTFTGTNPVSVNLAIPSTTGYSTTTLRIALINGYDSNHPIPQSSCESILGEYEDYTLIINQTGGSSGGGFQQQERMHNLRVFPNPTTSTTTVELDALEHQPLLVIVMDLAGKILIRDVYEDAPQLFSTDLDLSGLRVGMYIVRVAGPGFSREAKVIKQ